VVQAGERNRALTIVKSRGTRHSNQVRELILSDDGLTLTDVYTAGGAVLMGSLRAEKEVEETIVREEIRLELERKRRELAQADADAQARITELNRQILLRQEEMALLDQSQALREQEWTTRQGEIRTARRADIDTDIENYKGKSTLRSHDPASEGMV
jgi:circadian clock protein KaiC